MHNKCHWSGKNDHACDSKISKFSQINCQQLSLIVHPKVFVFAMLLSWHKAKALHYILFTNK